MQWWIAAEGSSPVEMTGVLGISLDEAMDFQSQDLLHLTLSTARRLFGR